MQTKYFEKFLKTTEKYFAKFLNAEFFSATVFPCEIPRPVNPPNIKPAPMGVLVWFPNIKPGRALYWGGFNGYLKPGQVA